MNRRTKDSITDWAIASLIGVLLFALLVWQWTAFLSGMVEPLHDEAFYATHPGAKIFVISLATVAYFWGFTIAGVLSVFAARLVVWFCRKLRGPAEL